MPERLGAFEVEPSYSDEPLPQGPRVLWGRVGVLGGALVLFFLLGRLTAPGGSSADVTNLRNQVASQASQIATLQAQLRGATAQSPSPTPSLSTSPNPSSSPTSSPPAAATTPTSYTVKSGDTLGGIAHTVYGTSSGYSTAALSALLMQANNITDAHTLRVGQVLTVPPASQAANVVIPSPSVAPSPKTSTSPHPSPSPTK